MDRVFIAHGGDEKLVLVGKPEGKKETTWKI
jgi:hypothetical protein